jgi:hypothetical protein
MSLREPTRRYPDSKPYVVMHGAGGNEFCVS